MQMLIRILLLLLLSISAWANEVVVIVQPTTPCTTMGASGTYDHWWNGQYPSDTDEACQDSGSSTATGTDSGGVIVDDGGGDYIALLNADDEYIRWAAKDQTLGTAGTVEINVTSPASYNDDQVLWEIYTDSNNQIIGYYHHSTGRIYVRHEGDSTPEYHFVATIGTSTTATIQFSWDDTTDYLCIKVDAGAWDCESGGVVKGFAGSVDSYAVGDDQNDYLTGTGTDAWKVNSFQIRVGYEGS